ncbi:MAG: branched-chain amino acid ABC transporter permease [Candidatus Dormibacteraeota bacterium]|uniref:Branched-chain amino acid ABC transporter permease n=1 Tax=Candidatus Aeolococcus gillhamiae TaxID=3127015 RepID=A0A934K1A7_9BACT|nr:branched-chain amino acid ABC transporter permease [Candidatus Dormibacteraeota bacterium]
MAYFVQQIVNGLETGGVYALVALGYTLIYGILELLNFAHGDVYMVGAFLAGGVATLLVHNQVSAVPAVLVVGLMVLAATLGAGVLGVGIERVAYRPLRNANRLAPLITAIGVSLLLESAVQVWVSPAPVLVPSNALVPQTVLQVSGVETPLMGLMLLVVSVALMVGLDVFVYRTRFGSAMRATAQDREAAAFMGIDINRVIMVTFFVASALAGLGGVLFGLRFATIDFYMGYVLGFKAFTAAVVGGIGNVRGAMVGGLLLGVLESLAGGFISTQFQNTLVFLGLITVLMVRPQGLFGQPLTDRA